ncbi:MAG: hypothetical protein Q9201_000400 [Fulgogasparrea decipioides]
MGAKVPNWKKKKEKKRGKITPKHSKMPRSQRAAKTAKTLESLARPSQGDQIQPKESINGDPASLFRSTKAGQVAEDTVAKSRKLFTLPAAVFCSPLSERKQKLVEQSYTGVSAYRSKLETTAGDETFSTSKDIRTSQEPPSTPKALSTSKITSTSKEPQTDHSSKAAHNQSSTFKTPEAQQSPSTNTSQGRYTGTANLRSKSGNLISKGTSNNSKHRSKNHSEIREGSPKPRDLSPSVRARERLQAGKNIKGESPTLGRRKSTAARNAVVDVSRSRSKREDVADAAVHNENTEVDAGSETALTRHRRRHSRHHGSRSRRNGASTSDGEETTTTSHPGQGRTQTPSDTNHNPISIFSAKTAKRPAASPALPSAGFTTSALLTTINSPRAPEKKHQKKDPGPTNAEPKSLTRTTSCPNLAALKEQDGPNCLLDALMGLEKWCGRGK